MVLLLGAAFLWGCDKSDEAKPGQQTAAGQPSKTLPRNKMEDIPDAPEPELLPVTRFQAGRLLEAKKDYFSAAIEYEKAINLNRDFTVAYIRLATCYIRLERLNVAEQVLRVGLQRQPKMASLHNNLGFVLLLQRRYPEAEAEFHEALAIQPKFVRAQVNLGLTLGYLGRFDQAFDTFKAVLPEADAHFNLGQVHELLGQRQQAVQSYKAALALAPDMPDAKTALERISAQSDSGPDASTPASPGVSFVNSGPRMSGPGLDTPATQPLAQADFVGPPVPSREVTPNPVVMSTRSPVASAPPPASSPALETRAGPASAPAGESTTVQVAVRNPPSTVVSSEKPASALMPPASSLPVTLPAAPEMVQIPTTQPVVVVAAPTPTPLGMGYPVIETTANLVTVKDSDPNPAQP